MVSFKADLKIDSMTDHEIGQLIEDLCEEISRRSIKTAEYYGICGVKDPVFGTDPSKPGVFRLPTGMNRIILDTPVGQLMLWRTFENAGVILNEVSMGDWVANNSRNIDKQWTDMVRNEEHVRDAMEALSDPNRYLTEGVRVYKKWEPVLRMMCAGSVHDE